MLFGSLLFGKWFVAATRSLLCRSWWSNFFSTDYSFLPLISYVLKLKWASEEMARSQFSPNEGLTVPVLQTRPRVSMEGSDPQFVVVTGGRDAMVQHQLTSTVCPPELQVLIVLFSFILDTRVRGIIILILQTRTTR